MVAVGRIFSYRIYNCCGRWFYHRTTSHRRRGPVFVTAGSGVPARRWITPPGHEATPVGGPVAGRHRRGMRSEGVRPATDDDSDSEARAARTAAESRRRSSARLLRTRRPYCRDPGPRRRPSDPPLPPFERPARDASPPSRAEPGRGTFGRPRSLRRATRPAPGGYEGKCRCSPDRPVRASTTIHQTGKTG